MTLRFAIVQNKVQQTNKTKINHINDNHIKFEFSLHFGGIWPTVRQQQLNSLLLTGNNTEFNSVVAQRLKSTDVSEIFLQQQQENTKKLVKTKCKAEIKEDETKTSCLTQKEIDTSYSIYIFSEVTHKNILTLDWTTLVQLYFM